MSRLFLRPLSGSALYKLSTRNLQTTHRLIHHPFIIYFCLVTLFTIAPTFAMHFAHDTNMRRWADYFDVKDDGTGTHRPLQQLLPFSGLSTFWLAAAKPWLSRAKAFPVFFFSDITQIRSPQSVSLSLCTSCCLVRLQIWRWQPNHWSTAARFSNLKFLSTVSSGPSFGP